MILLKFLYVTQKGLRNPDKFIDWGKFIKKGGDFGGTANKIKIAHFGDDRFYVRDGHHRVCAIEKGKRDYLYTSEYQIEEWDTYASWCIPNIPNGWITPFDPRIEIRFENVFNYKLEFKNCLEKDQLEFIRKNRYKYCGLRKDNLDIYTVKDLIQMYV